MINRNARHLLAIPFKVPPSGVVLRAKQRINYLCRVGQLDVILQVSRPCIARVTIVPFCVGSSSPGCKLVVVCENTKDGQRRSTWQDGRAAERLSHEGRVVSHFPWLAVGQTRPTLAAGASSRQTKGSSDQGSSSLFGPASRVVAQGRVAKSGSNWIRCLTSVGTNCALT